MPYKVNAWCLVSNTDVITALRIIVCVFLVFRDLTDDRLLLSYCRTSDRSLKRRQIHEHTHTHTHTHTPHTHSHTHTHSLTHTHTHTHTLAHTHTHTHTHKLKEREDC